MLELFESHGSIFNDGHIFSKKKNNYIKIINNSLIEIDWEFF